MESAVTPILKLSTDSKVWKRVDGAFVGKPGVSWWVLNASHPHFQENGVYSGVLHGELIPYGDASGREDVFTLAVDTGNGNKIFSFGFPEANANTDVFLNANSNKADDRRVLRIALELASHLPDSELSASLSRKISAELEKCDGSHKLWDKV